MSSYNCTMLGPVMMMKLAPGEAYCTEIEGVLGGFHKDSIIETSYHIVWYWRLISYLIQNGMATLLDSQCVSELRAYYNVERQQVIVHA